MEHFIKRFCFRLYYIAHTKELQKKEVKEVNEL